jgi:hypothetical protein
MMLKSPRRKIRHNKLHEQYRQLLKRPGLTPEKIEEMRKHIILLAQTICEYVWKTKFY